MHKKQIIIKEKNDYNFTLHINSYLNFYVNEYKLEYYSKL